MAAAKKGKGSRSAALSYISEQPVKISGKWVTKYRDSKGRFISKEKAEKSKRKKIYIDSKGNKKEPVKGYKVLDERPVIGQGFEGTVFNHDIVNNAESVISSGGSVYVKAGRKGKERFIEVDEATIGNLEAFTYEMINKAKDILGEIVGSLPIQYKVSTGKRGQVIDITDILTIDENDFGDEIEPFEKEAIKKWKREQSRIKSKYFRK